MYSLRAWAAVVLIGCGGGSSELPEGQLGAACRAAAPACDANLTCNGETCEEATVVFPDAVSYNTELTLSKAAVQPDGQDRVTVQIAVTNAEGGEPMDGEFVVVVSPAEGATLEPAAPDGKYQVEGGRLELTAVACDQAKAQCPGSFRIFVALPEEPGVPIGDPAKVDVLGIDDAPRDDPEQPFGTVPGWAGTGCNFFEMRDAANKRLVRLENLEPRRTSGCSGFACGSFLSAERRVGSEREAELRVRLVPDLACDDWEDKQESGSFAIPEHSGLEYRAWVQDVPSVVCPHVEGTVAGERERATGRVWQSLTCDGYSAERIQFMWEASCPAQDDEDGPLYKVRGCLLYEQQF